VKKIDCLRRSFERHAAVFRCPMCGGGLRVVEYTLVCAAGHCFDLAAKGYANVAPAASGSIGGSFYDKALFAARRAVFAQGFFAPMYRAVSEAAGQRAGVWLDAGCGEGSGLRAVGNAAALRVGIDLAKDGVRLAAQEVPDVQDAGGDFAWLVGDLAKLPLVDSAADVILNVLSPANYAEFARVLKPDGVVVKVIPGSRYLHELREAFFADSEKETHEANASAEAFMRAYPAARAVPVTYAVETAPALLKNLLDMTPLLQNVPQAEKDAFAQSGTRVVTADYIVLVSA